MARSKAPQRSRTRDADTAWKVVLRLLLPECIAFVHHKLHEAIDWQRPIEFLDKELQAMLRGPGRRGRRMVDLLVKVWLRDGREQWILLHLEVQASKQNDFARRMLLYHTRLLDRYEAPIVSLALLTDNNPTWRPNHYQHDFWDNRLEFTYPILKLLDWQGREEQLAQWNNPFAQVALAQLVVLTARGAVEPQVAAWRTIARQLVRARYPDEQIRAVFTMLDWLFIFPPAVEAELETELVALGGGVMVQVMTRWERRGWEKGLTEGREEGREEAQRELVLRLLTRKCGPLGEPLTAQVQALASAEVQALSEAFLDFTGRADLEGWLAARPSTRTHQR